MTADATSLARRTDAVALVVLLVVATAVLRTFRDYGLGWDDYTHSQYGDLLLSLYTSGFTDKRALSFVNLYMYGGGFDLLAACAAKLLPIDLFATRRLVGGAIGLFGLFLTWRLARRLGGPRAGLVALLLLAACPLYYGHMFINAKDAPFATAMVLALVGIVRAFEDYPRPKPSTVALCGIGIGLAVGSRVMGGFAVVTALSSLVFVAIVRARESALRVALQECGTFIVPLIPGVILAYIVMGLVWPWSVVAPLNPFHAVEYFSNFFEKPWRELFDGELIPVVDMPRSYVPTLFALKLPLLMLALGMGGTVGALVAAIGGSGRGGNAGRRAALFAVAVAAMLPIAVTVATRPAMYNGIRHFVFVLPPLALLGGLAGARLADVLDRRGAIAAAAGIAVLLVGLAAPTVELIRLHPFEYTYFNRLAGGVAGARPRYMLDYWGLSLTTASRELLASIEAHGQTPPAGATRTIAVCGPHPPVKVALGSQYRTTWNPKGADFAVMLGEFYCAKLDAPVVLDVVREGVSYARVYDIRGRSISSLLTVPGIDK